jgi:hypothetical protein
MHTMRNLKHSFFSASLVTTLKMLHEILHMMILNETIINTVLNANGIFVPHEHIVGTL